MVLRYLRTIDPSNHTNCLFPCSFKFHPSCPFFFTLKTSQRPQHRVLVSLVLYNGKFAFLDLHIAGSSSVQLPLLYTIWMGFLGGRWLRICLQFRSHRRCNFAPWVRKISWRREWLCTPVFLPGEPHRQRSLVGYSPYSCKEPDTTEAT